MEGEVMPLLPLEPPARWYSPDPDPRCEDCDEVHEDVPYCAWCGTCVLAADVNGYDAREVAGRVMCASCSCGYGGPHMDYTDCPACGECAMVVSPRTDVEACTDCEHVEVRRG